MNKEELTALAERLVEICNHVPEEQWQLKYVLAFSMMELHMYSNFGRQSLTFQTAVTFAKSIPTFTCYDGADFFDWIQQDEEYLKYIQQVI